VVPVDETHNEVTADAIGTVVQAGTIGSLRLPEQRRPTPKQLPAAPRHFVGRAAELTALDGALGGTAVIGGAGGVGKTWLALRWAHTHLGEFPDGRLHIDLQGFAPGAEPLAPAAAVRSFLDALGVRPSALPVSQSAQAALYRSLVAGRRLLIVLDNAEGEDQVEPLLPGSASCTVLVTSRQFLLGTVTRHGAVPVELDVLSSAESRQLLAARLGDERLAGDPEATESVLGSCGGLPLALATVAARAEQRARLPLDRLAGELRECRLDALGPVRGVLSWSCWMLSEEALTVFRLLGNVPGPDISLEAATSLAGISSARVVLRELEDAHLVQEHVPGRYRMHDLVRCFAAEQPVDHEPALRRLTDFYLHTAHTADELLHPFRVALELPDPVPGCAPLHLADKTAAVTWLQSEHRCLLEVQRALADLGWHADVWRLARLLNSFHYLQGHLRDQVVSWERGLAAARQLGDPRLEAGAHRLLGNAHLQVCDHPAAATHLRRALEIAPDLFAEGHACMALASVLHLQGRNAEALAHAERALRSFVQLGDTISEADARGVTGQLYVYLGDFEAARTMCEAALEMHVRQGSPGGEAVARNGLGHLARATGNPGEALEHHERALAVLRTRGDAWGEPNTLDLIGQAHAALGNHAQARETWQRALTMYEEQSRPELAERIRAQLAAL
jgi:tetratricopeptide (TPR) repeat protein